ncbi:MAG: hypothetical protein DU429_06790 [Candidatus Tokpelaia sp.]|nr:MAG: hypothetical protein DU430_07225 [Candidatus Tokpelaia sp.]KAA6206121.1 MAG: hypothetical protein DU429_06790 [Candidatus Tokpelaia sp.]
MMILFSRRPKRLTSIWQKNCRLMCCIITGRSVCSASRGFKKRSRKWLSVPIKSPVSPFFLTTGGGQAEAAEKFVDILRHNYGEVYFVVPVAAMSAGTILCMAGDKIYMDYSSSLGPIDPQIPDKEGKDIFRRLVIWQKLMS